LEVCAGQQPPVVHRDIKSGNILVTESSDFKLGDFGTVRNLEKTRGT
jgi:serine/threonine protein kinase